MSLSPPPLGLYVHLPWCVRKCPYCDFNSHQAPDQVPERGYVEALLADLALDVPAVWGRPVNTVFIGGGTPSLFSADAIAELISGIGALVTLEPGAEITLEANPGTVEHAPLADYRQAGVTRLSLGVQSFDDELLARIGRIHSAGEAEEAVTQALASGFERVNLDLMYALPGQNLDQAVTDLDRALSLGVRHLSHYQLTLEPNTAFHHRPPRNLPDDDTAWSMAQACQERLDACGLQQYEISAYAEADHRCRHNLNYWQFGDYLGIGAGAHGKVTLGSEGVVRRRFKQRHPRRYLETAGTPAAIGGESVLDAADLLFEFALNAFRLCDGVPQAWFHARTGLELDRECDPWRTAVERGWVDLADGKVIATGEGRRWLNDLQALFLPARPQEAAG